MKIANVKAMVVKGMLAVVVAGAFMMGAKAEAQGFAVGVAVGYPPIAFRYDHPRAREMFLRHEEWPRVRRFHGPVFYR